MEVRYFVIKREGTKEGQGRTRGIYGLPCSPNEMLPVVLLNARGDQEGVHEVQARPRTTAPRKQKKRMSEEKRCATSDENLGFSCVEH